MSIVYKEKILELIKSINFEIDLNIEVSGPPPTMASSDFLTNKEQGDWAEKLIQTAINESNLDLLAVHYGHSGSLAAGDTGFEEFYKSYQAELNKIGKRPDILIFKRSNLSSDIPDISKDEVVSSALAAIEVRSSSFLADRYAEYMEQREANALTACTQIKEEILGGELGELLKKKNSEIYHFLTSANSESFKHLDFRKPSWSSSDQLRQLTELLGKLKKHIAILQKRDYLSITPKIEDIALVNRWIQRFGVKHYYLQVFFDKAYLIPFKQILEIVKDEGNEGEIFSIEQDIKNQRKTTIKINVKVGQEVIRRIDLPSHCSKMKELERGRLLFYVTFDGGYGYLDDSSLKEVLRVD